MVGDVLDEGIVAGHMQKAEMRAIVHPSMIKAVCNALPKNDALMAPIATFVYDYVEIESKHVKKKDEMFGSKI